MSPTCVALGPTSKASTSPRRKPLSKRKLSMCRLCVRSTRKATSSPGESSQGDGAAVCKNKNSSVSPISPNSRRAASDFHCHVFSRNLKRDSKSVLERFLLSCVGFFSGQFQIPIKGYHCARVKTSGYGGKRAGLRRNCPDSSPGRGNCDMFLTKALHSRATVSRWSQEHTSRGIREYKLFEVTLRWPSHGISTIGEVEILLVVFCDFF